MRFTLTGNLQTFGTYFRVIHNCPLHGFIRSGNNTIDFEMKPLMVVDIYQIRLHRRHVEMPKDLVMEKPIYVKSLSKSDVHRVLSINFIFNYYYVNSPADYG